MSDVTRAESHTPISAHPTLIIRPEPLKPSWENRVNLLFAKYTLFASHSAERLRQKMVHTDLLIENSAAEKIAKLFCKMVGSIFLLPSAIAGAIQSSVERIYDCFSPKTADDRVAYEEPISEPSPSNSQILVNREDFEND